MKKFVLNNGLEIPVTGFGTFPQKEILTQSAQIAFKTGYRLFDTSDNYLNEEYLGEAVKIIGCAMNEALIITKFSQPLRTGELKACFDESLSKLAGKIDILLLHWPYTFLWKTQWRIMEQLYLEGRVRAIGVCNFEVDKLKSLLRFCKVKPTINQIERHPLFQQNEIVDFCMEYDSVRDIALLKVNTSYALPYLKISKVLPKQGEAVIAIGNPQKLKGTVSNGIVSAIREFDNNIWVQFTAPISRCSSGGALLNLNGEVVGMPTLIGTAEAAQNLNFAVAPTVLTQFLNSAINKPAKPLQTKPSMPPKTDTPKKTKHRLDSLPGAKFIRSDDGYEVYLDIESIKYDRHSKLASFITYWWPTEKPKIQMRRDPHFVINPDEDLGLCVLLYAVNFSNNTYMHLRTVNFCTNGNIARDYPRPPDEKIWRTAKKGSRIASLMQAVKKQLGIR